VMKRYIEEVKVKGADLVIGSAHLGIPWGVEDAYQRMIEKEESGEMRTWMINAMELAHQVPGIDILFCGHIHVGYRQPWEEPSQHTLLFQTYAYGSSLGMVTFIVDRKTKTLAGYEFPSKDGGLLTPFSDEFWPDRAIAQRIEEEVARVEKGMGEPIGYTKVNISRGDASNNLMGFVVVDAMRERMGGDFAFINLGGIRKEIPAGPITTKDVFEVLPFGNQAVIIQMDGLFLKKILEIRVSDDHHGLITSGGEIVYNHNRPDMDRVTRFEIGGQVLSPDKIYNVVTTDFIAQGNIGLNILTTLPPEKVYYSGVPVRLMVVEYIKEHSPLAPQVDGRWLRDDRSEIDEGLKRAFGKRAF
jgi:5'-nucleotidase/UDP-sugar diphosphatase